MVKIKKTFFMNDPLANQHPAHAPVTKEALNAWVGQGRKLMMTAIELSRMNDFDNVEKKRGKKISGLLQVSPSTFPFFPPLPRPLIFGRWRA